MFYFNNFILLRIAGNILSLCMYVEVLQIQLEVILIFHVYVNLMDSVNLLKI